MPFKSKKQARWMWANHPEMAKRWAAHTPDVESLPDEKEGEEQRMPSLSELFADRRGARS